MKYLILIGLLFFASCTSNHEQERDIINQKLEILGIEKTNELYRYGRDIIKMEIPKQYEKYEERLELIGHYKNRLRKDETIQIEEVEHFASLFEEEGNRMGFPNNYFHLLEVNKDNALNQYKYLMLIENYIFQLLNTELNFTGLRVEALQPFVRTDNRTYKLGETVNLEIGYMVFSPDDTIFVNIEGKEYQIKENEWIKLKANKRGKNKIHGSFKSNYFIDLVEIPFVATFEVE